MKVILGVLTDKSISDRPVKLGPVSRCLSTQSDIVVVEFLSRRHQRRWLLSSVFLILNAQAYWRNSCINVLIIVLLLILLLPQLLFNDLAVVVCLVLVKIRGTGSEVWDLY